MVRLLVFKNPTIASAEASKASRLAADYAAEAVKLSNQAREIVDLIDRDNEL